jgi:hypothetical protein
VILTQVFAVSFNRIWSVLSLECVPEHALESLCIQLVFGGKTHASGLFAPVVCRLIAVNLNARCAIGDSEAQNHAATANPLASNCVRRKCL